MSYIRDIKSIQSLGKNIFSWFLKYYSNEPGINSRIDEVQLSILNIKIKKVKTNIKKRLKIANFYNNELRNTSLKLPAVKKNNKHVFHLYTVYHKKRDAIIKKLKKKKIKLNIYYPYPIHQMKGYKKNFNSFKDKLPVTEKLSKGIFSLPLYPEIEKRDLIKIIKNLKKTLNTL